jgi:hypothetical protein
MGRGDNNLGDKAPRWLSIYERTNRLVENFFHTNVSNCFGAFFHGQSANFS